MKEYYYDNLLNIKTRKEQMGFHDSLHYHRYEPTPYHALEELFREYKLDSKDHVVDFGCGKGRLNFFIHYVFQSSVVGIEMNEVFCEEAIENRKNYLTKVKNKKGSIQFHCCLAEEYEIQPLDNRFYFFNPFSIQIFMRVINNILFSVESAPRDIEIILYYSSDEYLYYLDDHPMFQLKKEVNLSGNYEPNSEYERFLIYGLTY